MFNSIKKVFLLDGCGAVLSAFFLGIVIVHFNDYFGMPINTLYFLAGIAILFAVYSCYNYFFTPSNWRPYLTIIAFANILYAVITTACLFLYTKELNILDHVYFIGEIIVLLFVISLELRFIKNAKHN